MKKLLLGLVALALIFGPQASMRAQADAEAPAIGSRVRYVEMDGSLTMPAVVTAIVSGTTVNLAVAKDVNGTPTPERKALSWRYSVQFDGSAQPAPKTWHWPR